MRFPNEMSLTASFDFIIWVCKNPTLHVLSDKILHIYAAIQEGRYRERLAASFRNILSSRHPVGRIHPQRVRKTPRWGFPSTPR